MLLRSVPEVLAELEAICGRTRRAIEALHPTDGGLMIAGDWKPSAATAALLAVLRRHLRDAEDAIRKLSG